MRLQLPRGLAALVVIVAALRLMLSAPAAAAVEQPTPIIPLQDVRVGMKGYGKSVFHGDRIEAFACEVVSIVSDSSASRGTIWIECTDDRMQRSGPVQGMSGSPIYLWDEGEPQVPGEGGRLAGAFAFGFSDVNVCLVGVQPIEYMREVGQRAAAFPEPQSTGNTLPPGEAKRNLAILRQAADDQSLTAPRRLMIDAVSKLTLAWPGPQQSLLTARPVPAQGRSSPQPLLLPFTVGDRQTAELLNPLLASAGLHALAADRSWVAGDPPSNVDPARVRLEPGSVLSVPLAFGDIDLNASGTVTDVLPDGTVIAFGHPAGFTGGGQTRLPMATGYTHYVVSRNTISFKRSSTLEIVGTVARNEESAVAGIPAKQFETSPITIAVDMPGQPRRSYQYHLVDHPQLAPSILAALINASVTAVQSPPTLHTIRLQGDINFVGGHHLALDRSLPVGGVNGLAFDILPLVSTLSQNPFEPLGIESADLSVAVSSEVESAQILAASISKPVAQPGDRLELAVTVQPYNAASEIINLPLDLPSDLPAGEYQIMLSGAASYTMRQLLNNPRFSAIADIESLSAAIQEIVSVDQRAVYAYFQRPQPGLAVGKNTLDSLPSSKLAMLSASSNSSLQSYPRFVSTSAQCKAVVDGEVSLTVRVQAQPPGR